MSERDQEEQPPGAAALRRSHAARAESAAARAAALSHYVEHRRGPAAETAGSADRAEAVWKSQHAARVAAQALAVISESAPDPAADSRCARNAAASAAQASRMGRLIDDDAEPSVAACEAALKASLAASAAAGAGRLGADGELNSEADEAEKAAVAAAERAGWIRPGQQIPSVSTGVRSGEVMSMMHL
ncbi:hypothetical protein CG740_05585 [Streptomyces sp. CB01201]|uniref:hypothetical protein n=1 Tax=Streptomyces sp. CB01201 TaxID=2020324 RepID=UPI000C276309|nr:hypothetical protein [Streptomyces sp. CB01201]PJN03863.1 hypothetical protein CG740_05585 [Streptomyces sp. CB01201]